jgi:hypothetical protein
MHAVCACCTFNALHRHARGCMRCRAASRARWRAGCAARRGEADAQLRCCVALRASIPQCRADRVDRQWLSASA